MDLHTARAAGLADLEIVVDTRERYAWRFTHQQATTRRSALHVGDHGAFVDDELVAVVERTSLGDLAGSLTSGRLAYRFLAAAVQEHRATQAALDLLPDTTDPAG